MYSAAAFSVSAVVSTAGVATAADVVELSPLLLLLSVAESLPEQPERTKAVATTGTDQASCSFTGPPLDGRRERYILDAYQGRQP
ncbi:hypothetical protein GCM10023114_33290 [Mycolicibacterium sediminis]|uniref:Uncharacterized protein n=1 Tax=Mycolicibacterium sediminis TaxID=1286180 RepID=A0A7I7QZ04_9MYCO|nr:hypothetical protein MSEDJ_57150 [Mycolicibacterium sediminis]